MYNNVKHQITDEEYKIIKDKVNSWSDKDTLDFISPKCR